MSVQTVSSASTSALPILKRKRTSSASSSDDVPLKKNMWYYVLEPELGDGSSDDAESVYSFQDKSTEYVRDTSDTSSKMSSSDDEGRMLEFDVVSQSDEDINPLPSDSDSSLPDVSHSAVVFGVSSTLESDSFADSSSICSAEGSGTKDTELSPADFWSCIRCKEPNNNPLFRYCEKCYKIRKNFFPPRPQGRRSKNKSKSVSSTSREHSSQDSGVSVSSVGSYSSGEELCEICLAQPKDGGYCHGSVTHVYSCYNCSKRTLRQLGRCPICNLRVKQVVRVIKA